MAIATTAQITDLFGRMTDAWTKGSGADFGSAFAEDAHFVAFDGTVLKGPSEIARYHQAAFDHYLQGTNLVITVESTQTIGDDALLVFTHGAIRTRSGARVGLTGDSIGMTVVQLEGTRVLAQAFQNTRQRPIKDEKAAAAWKQFDAAWSEITSQENDAR